MATTGSHSKPNDQELFCYREVVGGEPTGPILSGWARHDNSLIAPPSQIAFFAADGTPLAFGTFEVVPCIGDAAGVDVEVTRRCIFDADGAQVGEAFGVRGYDQATGDFVFARTENADGTSPVTVPAGGYLGECIEEQFVLHPGGINILAGNTTPVELSNLFPGLQSVSLLVFAGVVEISAFNGVSQVPAGASVTWSVNDTDDTVLSSLMFTGTDADTHFYLAFTYKQAVEGVL